MYHLQSIGGLTALTVLIGMVIGAWPGSWALIALVPGVILGGTLSHFLGARAGHNTLRPGVLAIGVVLGGLGVAASMIIFSAAAAPEHVNVKSSRVFAAPAESLWRRVADPLERPRWSSLIRDPAAIGDLGPPKPTKRYRCQIAMESRAVPAKLEILSIDAPKRVTLKIHFPPGTTMLDVTNTIELEPIEGKPSETLVTYTMNYRLPDLMSRVANQLAVEGSLEAMLEQDLTSLHALILP